MKLGSNQSTYREKLMPKYVAYSGMRESLEAPPAWRDQILCPDTLVDDAIKSIGIGDRIQSIILHGSRAIGNNDIWSDIDLLVIMKSGTIRSIYREHNSIIIDITAGSCQQFRNRLERVSKNNANFVLNALCNGKLWMDSCGEGARLIRDAWTIRMRGPVEPSLCEVGANEARLKKLARSVERLNQRASIDPDILPIAIMRCDELAVSALYSYHRLRKLWATGLVPLLREARINAPELHELWKQYALAIRLNEKYHYAVKLAELAHRDVGGNFSEFFQSM